MRSEEVIIKETDDTAEKIPPDATACDNEHMLVRNLTSTEPVVFGPIVNPPMVIATAADADMVEPEVVITTTVAEVGPIVAVKPTTLLAPGATDGTTPDTKKLEGYKRLMTLPNKMERKGVNFKVTKTGDLPTNRSEEAISRKNKCTVLQTSESCQSNLAVEINGKKGVCRTNIEPSPSCTDKHVVRNTIRAPAATR
jgi:hypothetical protein